MTALPHKGSTIFLQIFDFDRLCLFKNNMIQSPPWHIVLFFRGVLSVLANGVFETSIRHLN